MLLPRDCHSAFRDAYRAHHAWSAEESTWVRARGWALALSLAFLAHSADNPLMAKIGQRTLDAVLAKPLQLAETLAETEGRSRHEADGSPPVWRTVS
jgi:hypothetical protein